MLPLENSWHRDLCFSSAAAIGKPHPVGVCASARTAGRACRDCVTRDDAHSMRRVCARVIVRDMIAHGR